jgi:Domain of unknown function (DUF1996)
MRRITSLREPTALKHVPAFRHLLLILAGLVLAASALTVPSAHASSPGWVNQCYSSHFNNDDPVVFPGQQNITHLHNYLGNNTTQYDSTYTSLLAAQSPWNSTCPSNSKDTAAYWFPAFLVSGVAEDSCTSHTSATPRCSNYYRDDNVSASYRAAHLPEPWPAGFKMLAGNSHATSVAENPYLGRELYYGCSNNSESGKPTAPISCSTGYGTVHIGFPNCWSGTDLTSDTGGYNAYAPGDPAHDSLRYPSSGVCPAGFTHLMPRLIIRVEYAQSDPSAITLSSGATYTLHGDFWNAWDQTALSSLVSRCLAANGGVGVDCGNDPTP